MKELEMMPGAGCDQSKDRAVFGGKEANVFPGDEGFYMPGEYAPHEATLMIWPERPGSWSHGARAAREAFRQIIWALAKHEEVYVFAGAAVIDNARAMLLEEAGGWKERIHIVACETDDAWARDTGATFLLSRDGSKRMGVDWQFNAWGGDYDGLYAHWDKDQEVAGKICRLLGNPIYDARSFVLEGGSIHSDGEGTLLTTEECLLSPGRNPQLNKEEIEEKLKAYLGIEKVIWLPEGIYNDETNGHVDNMCCFVRPGHVLLAWTDDPEDPQYARSLAALRVLEVERDARGRQLVVHKLPIPRLPQTIKEADLTGFDFEEGEDCRELGERLAASYVNFYIGNGCVLLPQFGDAHDKLAVEILKECFPDREIVPIYARDILTGGGNIHCITQQIPALAI